MIRAASARTGLTALAAVTLAYLAIFALVRPFEPAALLSAALRNGLSLLLMALAALAALRQWAAQRSWPGRRLAYLVGAPLFSVVWYWLLTVIGAVFDAGSPLTFTVEPFLLNEAAEWQLFQGLFVFAALAAWFEVGRHESASVPVIAEPSRPEARPLLVRVGDEMLPLQAETIVTVTGADDYSEVALIDRRRHLVRTTLGEFERLLDPAGFVRIHRSTIVALARIERAEPAGGGRLSVRMNDGQIVQASRHGARLLRERLL